MMSDTEPSTSMIIGSAKQKTIAQNCAGCRQGAQHTQVSHMPLRQTQRKLEAVWTDVKGPLLDKAIYGFRYFVTFMDGLPWVFPLINKSEVFAAFRLFAAMATYWILVLCSGSGSLHQKSISNESTKNNLI